VLSTRLWTAAIALPALLVVIVFLPNWSFSLFIAALGAWGLYEVGAMTRADSAVARALLIFTGAGSAALVLVASNAWNWIVPAAVFLIMLALVARIAMSGPQAITRGLGLTLTGAAYVGALFPYFALLRNQEGGVALVILMLLLVIACDSGAYFAGSNLGRIKLAPRVSPNKTIEGAAGGLLAAAGAGLIIRPLLIPRWNLAQTLTVSLAVAVLAVLGDLAGSALKRASGVKDSGWIFPGHGGLIDRTCSLVFAAVFTYYYAR
jgi:phosphatidate cytidylyltransferase